MIDTMTALTRELFGNIFPTWIECEPIKYLMCFVMVALSIKIVKSLLS